MNDKTLKMIETISNVFNSISIFITGLAMLFFLLCIINMIKWSSWKILQH